MMAIDRHVFAGLQLDTSVSKHQANFLRDALNIRFNAVNLTTNEKGQVMSITNERGTSKINNTPLEGAYLGHCTINDTVIIFTVTTDGKGRIHIIKNADSSPVFSTILEEEDGVWNFDEEHPIEALGVYENENIQKVYWIDGKNQPRYINIADPNCKVFDFVPSLALNEYITVNKVDGAGMFTPGTIQYAFSYYNKFGRQSNIFYTTPLYYISYPNRGASPEDIVACSFRIAVTYPSGQPPLDDFDYLRIYSIHRTSRDTTPTVKRVADLLLQELEAGSTPKISYIDTGTVGNTIDPTELLYIGGETIIPNTMATKDNTLFFGNYSIERDFLKDVQDYFTQQREDEPESIEIDTENSSSFEGDGLYNVDAMYYNHIDFLNKGVRPGFKRGETYRLGIQFQHKNGKWSRPIFINDVLMDNAPSFTYKAGAGSGMSVPYSWTLTIPKFHLNLNIDDTTIVNKLKEYKRVRAICVFPSFTDRTVVAQGLLCPTVFNARSRANNTPFAQASWFFRPHCFLSDNGNTQNLGADSIKGGIPEFRHLHSIGVGYATDSNGAQYIDRYSGELDIDKISGRYPSYFGSSEMADDDFQKAIQNLFFVDQSIVTFHSPDVEFTDEFASIEDNEFDLRIVGQVVFTANSGDMEIQTITPAMLAGGGFMHETQYSDAGKNNYGGAFHLMGKPCWKDGILYKKKDEKKSDEINSYVLFGNTGTGDTFQEFSVKYWVFPWQRTGSLNNDEKRHNDSGSQSAKLETKKLSNLMFSNRTVFFGNNEILTMGINPVNIFDSGAVTLIKVPIDSTRYKENTINYYGNVDTMVSDFDPKPVYLSDGTTPNEHITVGNNERKIENPIHNIRIKYKSTKHLVFSLKHTTEDNVIKQTILPVIGQNAGSDVGALTKRDNFWLEHLIPSDYTSVRCIIKKTQAEIENNFNDNWLDWIDEVLPSSAPALETGDLFILCQNNTDPKIYGVYKVTKNVLTSGQTETVTYSKEKEHTISKYYKVYDTSISEPDYLYFEGTGINENQVILLESWEGQSEGAHQVVQNKINSSYNGAYLLLGELVRTNTENRFGGTSNDALMQNMWVPAGEPVDLDRSTENNIQANIEWTVGDTWFQRYDCMKTYPYTREDENSIIEIGSFLCETRVNLEGRYDRNRGQKSNLHIDPTNFNLLNKAYTQDNNFFNYRIMDEDLYRQNKFENSLLWSRMKSPGATTDIWTNITIANGWNLDGVYGPLNMIRIFNDQVLCFQNTAISRLMFNSRVQIPTSDGVPIEISNSRKVDDLKYINTQIGCNNKKAYASSATAAYFIDSTTKHLFAMGGDLKLADLSNVKLVNSFYDTLDSNTKLFYDRVKGDMYTVTSDKCLAFSEVLNEFTSFMSYNSADAIFNVGNKAVFIETKDTVVGNGINLYYMYEGAYNNFKGMYHAPYITFISNENPSMDKIFTNIEYRADFYNNDTLLHDKSFAYIQVWNEYQNTGQKALTFDKMKSSNEKKKFRIWRAFIPRQEGSLNRIRNTWTNIKIGLPNTGTTDKFELHDMLVYYYV